MSKVAKSISILTVALLLTSLIVTVLYYNSLVGDKVAKISTLESQINNLNNKTANLTSQVANLSSVIYDLTSANLVSNLNVTEEPDNSDLVNHFPTMAVTPIPYYSLWINGTVTNTGHVIAYKAGLNVTAYASDGTLEVNMTIPLLANAVYGTDNPTMSMIVNNPLLVVGHDLGSVHFGQISSLQLGNLGVGQNANIFFAIYHEGIVANWTVIPVWSNIP